MTDRAAHPRPRGLCFVLGALFVFLTSGCSTTSGRAGSGAAGATPPPAARADLGSYLELLARMAPGDAVSQHATLQATRDAWQRGPTAANVLQYALVLGTPGHPDSNPVEASRLLAGLLSEPSDLSTEEIRLAAAFQREFNARIAQYAELARARDDAEMRLRAAEAASAQRLDAMSADLARLRRERDAIQHKLDAIADIERSLMERDSEATPPRAETP